MFIKPTQIEWESLEARIWTLERKVQRLIENPAYIVTTENAPIVPLDKNQEKIDKIREICAVACGS